MLMLLLFVVGVMNLAWVALIAAFVFLEKLLPGGRLTSRLAGVALIGVGLTILIAPDGLEPPWHLSFS
jgi:predicted metal-binding membrane protein